MVIVEKAAESVRGVPRVLAERWDGHDSFTIGEAGEILKLNRWTAYYSAKKGRIPTNVPLKGRTQLRGGMLRSS